MMRIVCLFLFALTITAAENLTPDSLYGIWVVVDTLPGLKAEDSEIKKEEHVPHSQRSVG